MDYYRILGIDKDVSSENVKKAYRNLAKVYHPDLNNVDNAEYIFIQIKQAYDVLSDPVSRRAYDCQMGFPDIDKYTEQHENQSYKDTTDSNKGRSENEYSKYSYHSSNHKSDSNSTKYGNARSDYRNTINRSSKTQKYNTGEKPSLRERILASLLFPFIPGVCFVIIALLYDPITLAEADYGLVFQVYLFLIVCFFIILSIKDT